MLLLDSSTRSALSVSYLMREALKIISAQFMMRTAEERGSLLLRAPPLAPPLLLASPLLHPPAPLPFSSLPFPHPPPPFTSSPFTSTLHLLSPPCLPFFPRQFPFLLLSFPPASWSSAFSSHCYTDTTPTSSSANRYYMSPSGHSTIFTIMKHKVGKIPSLKKPMIKFNKKGKT